MMVITSRQNTQIKNLINIKNNPGTNLFIEGLHLIELAHRAHLVIELYGVKPFPNGERATMINESVAKKLSDKVTTEGYFALIKRPVLTLDQTKHLLYLDEVTDPGNVGTLLRTALAFNFGGVILSAHSVNVYNQKVLNAAQGAHFLLPIVTMGPEEVSKLVQDGYQIAVTTLQEAQTIDNITPQKTILVLGNEARGVSKKMLKAAHFNVKIPIHEIDSLNVAIAGAILMYELAKIV